jgi:hypothetical protein
MCKTHDKFNIILMSHKFSRLALETLLNHNQLSSWQRKSTSLSQHASQFVECQSISFSNLKKNWIYNFTKDVGEFKLMFLGIKEPIQ